MDLIFVHSFWSDTNRWGRSGDGDVSRLFNFLAIVCWFVVGGCCCSSSSVANPCKFNNIIFSSDIEYKSQRGRRKRKRIK